MRRPVLFLAISSIAILMSGAARADWQYARWGMTPEEVIAAANGTAHKVSPEKISKKHSSYGDGLVEADYRTKQFSFSTLFSFRENRLFAVRLTPKNAAQGSALDLQLRAVYGPPAHEKTNDKTVQHCLIDTADWRVSAEGNDISFQNTRCYFAAINQSTQFSSVIYSQIVTGHSNGL